MYYHKLLFNEVKTILSRILSKEIFTLIGNVSTVCVNKFSDTFLNFLKLIFLRTDLCRNREAAESEACATMGLGN